MKTKIFLLLYTISTNLCLGQNNSGPRLAAMGNTGASIPDVWSVSDNPSLITEISAASLTMSYEKPLLDLPISSQAVGLIYPFKKGAIAGYCYRYGIEDFNEIRASTLIAKKFGRVFSIAMRGNYHQIKIT